MSSTSGSPKPTLVYFSSTSEITKRFVDRLPFESYRIPVSSAAEIPVMDHDYVLVTPTYGAGSHKDANAVPKQIMRFLSHAFENRVHCVGIIGAGNKNFGEDYILAAKMLSKKLQSPILYDVEFFGTEEDASIATETIERYWLLYAQK